MNCFRDLADSRICSGIRRDLARLYPLLIGILPVLHTVAYQPGKASHMDLLLICSGLFATFGLLYLFLARSVGNTWLPSLCTLTAIVWFYLFPYAQVIVPPKISPFMIAGFGGLLTGWAFLVWTASRRVGLCESPPAANRRSNGGMAGSADREYRDWEDRAIGPAHS